MKSISRKFHHLVRIHSNRKPRYYKVFRKAKIRPIPDLEHLDERFFKTPLVMFQPVEPLPKLIDFGEKSE